MTIFEDFDTHTPARISSYIIELNSAFKIIIMQNKYYIELILKEFFLASWPSYYINQSSFCFTEIIIIWPCNDFAQYSRINTCMIHHFKNHTGHLLRITATS